VEQVSREEQAMPENDLEDLNAIIGTWDSEGETVAADDAIRIRGQDRYEWLQGHQYLVHRIDVTMGDDEVHAIEIIGGFDAERAAYEMHAFQNGTGHSLMHASRLEQGTWRFANEETRATLTLPADGRTMSARWERRNGARWVPWMNMRFTRAAQR
jgi:hypothetical protein